MLSTVVIVFTVSWLPLQTISLITYIWPELVKRIVVQSLAYNVYIATYLVSHWLAMAHSCMNPLIYCFMVPRFRADFKRIILRMESPSSSRQFDCHVRQLEQWRSRSPRLRETVRQRQFSWAQRANGEGDEESKSLSTKQTELSIKRNQQEPSGASNAKSVQPNCPNELTRPDVLVTQPDEPVCNVDVAERRNNTISNGPSERKRGLLRCEEGVATQTSCCCERRTSRKRKWKGRRKKSQLEEALENKKELVVRTKLKSVDKITTSTTEQPPPQEANVGSRSSSSSNSNNCEASSSTTCPKHGRLLSCELDKR